VAAASTHNRLQLPIDQTDWSRNRVKAFVAALSSPSLPEGVLRIPSIALEVPIYAGTSEINLNRGAAHIEGTAGLDENGNIGIAGHRDGFFRKLKDLALDAEVDLTISSRTLRYRVAEISIVDPADTEILDRTAISSITLVTCYPFYFVGNAPLRYIVRAERIDGERT
jgi:sortase A